MRVKALEDAIQKLVQVQAQNLQQIKLAFEMVDQHVFVSQRVFNDMCPADADKNWVERTSKGELNLTWYHRQYAQMQMFSMFMGWLAKLLSGPEKENVQHFGGDYVSRTDAAEGA